ncbi:MAG: hypothetical protein JW931_02065 [Methanomicrobiaceae archaeon]|nr:hypothetical protein [Methanomicrobiaceae archaeon]
MIQKTAVLLLFIGIAISSGCIEPTATTGDVFFVEDDHAGIKGFFKPPQTYFGDYDIWMEYGKTTAYGASTEITKLSSPLGEEIVFTITGLEPDTKYHYRSVMAYQKGNAIEYVYGEDRTFRTLESRYN